MDFRAKYVAEEYLAYKNNCRTVRRIGFPLYGVPELSVDELFRPLPTNRDENILEHQAATALLFLLIYYHFPDYYTWLAPELVPIAVFVLLTHDYPEGVMGGDTPADGTQNEDIKILFETSAYTRCIRNLPTAQRHRIRDLYGGFNSKDERLGRVLYLCDKFEAVGQALVYAKNRHPGDGNVKDTKFRGTPYGGLSAQDRACIEVTGSTEIAPNWGLNFYNICQSYPVEAQPFVKILREAFRLVYGKVPDYLLT